MSERILLIFDEPVEDYLIIYIVIGYGKMFNYNLLSAFSRRCLPYHTVQCKT